MGGGGLNAFILVSLHVCVVAVDWFSWGRRGFDVEGAAFMSGPRRWAHSMDASLSLPSAVCLTRAATVVSYVLLLRLCGAGWFGELRPFWACPLPLLDDLHALLYTRLGSSHGPACTKKGTFQGRPNVPFHQNAKRLGKKTRSGLRNPRVPSHAVPLFLAPPASASVVAPLTLSMGSSLAEGARA